MKESQLRDLISFNITKLKSDLTLLKKEQYIPNEFGTNGFIDLYAKDKFGNHVLIEIKRSDAASREALHEINKYVEGVKRHFGVKDTEIHVIIASSEWGELLVPFSRFLNDTTFSLQGYEIVVTEDETDFHANLVNPLSISQGRFIAPWHDVYWYKDANALENGVRSIQTAYQEKQIEDYVLVAFYFKNQLSAEERLAAMRASIARIMGVDESEISSLPEIPVHEYIAYTGLQMLTKEKCLQILSCDADAMEEVQELLPTMEEEDALCYLHESVAGIKPRPENDHYEIGDPAKFGKLLDAPNSKILKIVRHGSFARNTLLCDDTIISELRGEDGSTGQKFKRKISVSNPAHIKSLKSDILFCLAENPIWKAHILRMIEEIQIEFPNSEIDISIYNPCTGVFTIYYATTKEDGFLYIPSYSVIVHHANGVRVYFGAPEKSGEALSFPQILDKYYEGSLTALLLSVTWGGRDTRDSDIVEDLGMQYCSFRCDVGQKNAFFKLRDEKWRTCEPTNVISLFSEYLEANKTLVLQINTKIRPLDKGNVFCSG